MQYPGISQAVNGAIKAQVESWKWFSLLEPRVGLVWALVLTRHTSVQHQELSGLEQAGWTLSSPSFRVCRQSPWEMSQPCSPSSAPLSNRCTQGLSGSRKGQTRLLQAGLVSENTCISEDESAACHLNALCISPCPTCETQLRDDAHPALTLSAAAAQAEPLAAASLGTATALALDIQCVSNLVINSGCKQPSDIFSHWKHISSWSIIQNKRHKKKAYNSSVHRLTFCLFFFSFTSGMTFVSMFSIVCYI